MPKLSQLKFQEMYGNSQVLFSELLVKEIIYSLATKKEKKKIFCL